MYGARSNPNLHPIPPSTGNSIKCVHEWVYQETHYSCDNRGGQSTYGKLDIYYCSKCLEKKEILRKESSRDKPLWWMH